jgi:hypothetical protein
MNLTENIFDRWPVTMEVVKLNCSVSEPGLYEWMLMRWSSEPEARRRPDRDQLAEAHQYLPKLQGGRHIPQGVHTSVVPLQLIHNVEIVNPVLVAVDSSYIRVRPALMANLALQQAIVHGVLHLGGSRCSVQGRWQAPRTAWMWMWMWMVVARQATELHASVHKSASNGKVQLVRPKFLRAQARTGAAHTHCGA